MRKKKFRFGYGIVYLILILWALTTVFPLGWSVMNSFKNKKMIYSNSFAFPLGEAFSLDNYRNIFANYNILSAYRNSLIISGSVAAAAIILAGMAAYVLCRYEFPGKKLLNLLLYAGMMFPIYSTIIPVMRMQAKWGIVNSPSVGANLLSVILPQIAGNLSFAIIVLISYIRTLPVELEEAAMLEGCGKWQIFTKVIFPLLQPTTVTIAVLDALWAWNDFNASLIVLQKDAVKTIPMQQYVFFGEHSANYNMAFASAVISMVPVVVFFIIMQSRIQEGMTAGAVKG